MNHEDFVTYEQAQKLKELGFDWECNHYYKVGENHRFENYAIYSVEELDHISSAYEDLNNNHCISAPTLAQAAKWLREKGIIIIVDYSHYDNFEQLYYFDIKRATNNRVTVGVETDTYEQALSAGIDKALKLLNF